MKNGKSRNLAVYGESIETRLPRAERVGRREGLAIVQLVSDEISCNLYVRSFNSAGNSVTYELIIANRNNVDIACRLYGLDTTLHTREFGMLRVPKHAAGSSLFSVPLQSGISGRIFVEVLGEGISLFAEALQPVAPEKSRQPRTASVALIAFALIASIASYIASRPSIDALSAPSIATPGTVRTLYAYSGSATASYRALAVDGTVLARGPLRARSGEIDFRISDAETGHAVRLIVDASGPLGRVSSSRIIRVVPRSLVDAATYVERGGDLPAVTGTKPATSFAVPQHLIAGQPFAVTINRPEPGLHVVLRDGMQAVVDETTLRSNANSVTFVPPVSPTSETYYLTSTSKRGDATHAQTLALQVHPR